MKIWYNVAFQCIEGRLHISYFFHRKHFMRRTLISEQPSFTCNDKCTYLIFSYSTTLFTVFKIKNMFKERVRLRNECVDSYQVIGFKATDQFHME